VHTIYLSSIYIKYIVNTLKTPILKGNMGFRTPIICTVATLIFAQFLPAQYAFVFGAIVILLPLRLTILPGHFPSWTGALSSASALLSNSVGLALWQCLLIGAFIGPIAFWIGFWYLSGKTLGLTPRLK